MTASDMARIIVEKSGRFSLRGSNVFFLMENVSWGLFNWGEVDLLVCSKALYLTDVEIKLSISDLRADFRKRKWRSNRFKADIKHHYYAVPKEIEVRAISVIEQHRPNSGIIVVEKKLCGSGGNEYHIESCRVLKQSKANNKAKAFPGDKLINLARLSMFRYWRKK